MAMRIDDKLKGLCTVGLGGGIYVCSKPRYRKVSRQFEL